MTRPRVPSVDTLKLPSRWPDCQPYVGADSVANQPMLHRKCGLPLGPETPSSEPASQEREQRDNEEDDEEDFRHSHEGTCNSSKSEECSDQSDDETSDC